MTTDPVLDHATLQVLLYAQGGVLHREDDCEVTVAHTVIADLLARKGMLVDVLENPGTPEERVRVALTAAGEAYLAELVGGS